MLIDTTITVHVRTVKALADAVRATGLTGRNIMSWLLNELAGEKVLRPAMWSRFRYQERDLKENWRRLHLSLTPAEYELFLDLKKLYKLSGSRILAFAVEAYLEKLCNAFCDTSGAAAFVEKPDNYRFSNYSFDRLYTGRSTCLVLTWGIPVHVTATARRSTGAGRAPCFIDPG